MEIVQNLLSLGGKHGRPGTKLEPQGIVIHYVANPGSSALANRNWFENGSGGAGASAHYIIDISGEIIQCIPDNEVAYHAGRSFGPSWDTMSKTNNYKFIGIECCHPKADGKFSDNTINSLVWLVKLLCEKFNIINENIYRHYDVTGKKCPLYYVNKPDEWFKLKQMFIVEQISHDDEPSQWAEEFWKWTKENELNDGTRPKDNITREESVALLNRFYHKFMKD